MNLLDQWLSQRAFRNVKLVILEYVALSNGVGDALWNFLDQELKIWILYVPSLD